MRLIYIFIISILLAGCAGSMSGMTRSDGEKVAINYSQGMVHDNLTVTMPDGEEFKGKVVMVGGSTSHASIYGTDGNAFATVNTYTGNMHGVLFGDAGHSMVCKLQYADSSGFTSMGGVGMCETSASEVIDVQW